MKVLILINVSGSNDDGNINYAADDLNDRRIDNDR